MDFHVGDLALGHPGIQCGALDVQQVRQLVDIQIETRHRRLTGTPHERSRSAYVDTLMRGPHDRVPRDDPHGRTSTGRRVLRRSAILRTRSVLSLTQLAPPVGNTQALSDPEPHPLLQPLWERLRAWRHEIGVQPCPDRRKLQEALAAVTKAGLEAEVVLVMVAMCERWFRVYRPTTIAIRKALQRRLSTSGYTPYGMTGSAPLPAGPGQLALVGRYVDHCLREVWEEEASAERDHFVRLSLRGQVPSLVREYARPFLVAEYRRLSPKRGVYPHWASWVVATAVYEALRRRYPRKQDSTARATTMLLLEALRGTMPDDSHFRRQRRAIQQRAPRVAERLYPDLRDALAAYGDLDQRRQRLAFLLDTGRWDSLQEWGGMTLLLSAQRQAAKSSSSREHGTNRSVRTRITS